MRPFERLSALLTALSRAGRAVGRDRSSGTTVLSEPLFEPRPDPHGDAVVTGEAFPFGVLTPEARWAFGAAFPRTPAAPPRPCLVRVRLHVERGTIGVGILEATGGDFLDEAFVEASPDVQVAELSVWSARVGALIVRNGSATGSSRALVLGIECMEMPVTDDAPREPPLSEPPRLPGWSRVYGAGSLTPAERSRAARFQALEASLVLTWADGLSFTIVPREQVSRAVYLSGTYEPHTLRVIRRYLRPGDVVLDVGANAGIVSLAASRWVGPAGRVFAFEPSTREFARLSETIARNRAENITAVHAAAGARAGAAALRVADAAHAGLNTLGRAFAWEAETDRLERVEVVALDRFADRHAVRGVRLIKLDIEGAEGEALTGARGILARDRPILVVEVLGRALAASGWTVGALERVIRAAGYDIFAIDDDTATLQPAAALGDEHEVNVVALPSERREQLLRAPEP
jgi:FkbM family methyltransferase